MIPKKPTEVKSLSVELVGKVLLNSRDRKPYYGNAKKLGMRKKMNFIHEFQGLMIKL